MFDYEDMDTEFFEGIPSIISMYPHYEIESSSLQAIVSQQYQPVQFGKGDGGVYTFEVFRPEERSLYVIAVDLKFPNALTIVFEYEGNYLSFIIRTYMKGSKLKFGINGLHEAGGRYYSFYGDIGNHAVKQIGKYAYTSVAQCMVDFLYK